MRVIVLCLLLDSVLFSNAESHSLIYIYTALSRPVSNPGIHEFSALGVLDSRLIDYFDSDLQQRVPKQSWMRENLSPDYWVKGTEARKHKHQWFKINLELLQERMNHTEDGLHVLQWSVGCEADLVDDRLVFRRGIYQFAYDGNTFFYFDDTYNLWVAAAKEAEPTKRKYDEVQVMRVNTNYYLENKCVDWLEKFLNFSKAQLRQIAPPEVYLFAVPSSKSETIVRLICLATGFLLVDVELILRRNGRVLTSRDGVWSSKIRPNGDQTFQRRDEVEILQQDAGEYSCEFLHSATGINITEQWSGNSMEQEGVKITTAIAVATGVLVLVVPILLLIGIIYLMRTFPCGRSGVI